MKFIPVSTERQMETVESLAREIWTSHYTPIIGKEQVEYMLGRFQSRQAVSEQIRAGMLYFLMQKDGEAAGYIAIQPKGSELFLSKIYVKASSRRKGLGRKALQFAETLAKEKGLRKITLTVNKNNRIAITVYEREGFRNAGSLVQDIGGGFVMDDYRMEKVIEPD